ncbi:MAG TPA: co-chaperone GroES, partial [Candidatus Megaira endosymbiont of Hartmannula sinica]|nr:co-chaperone GroES [Candidatus Megaera endosymbiont of Hartmannula sinica]
MNIQPLHDRIVVQPQNVETKTASGIIIPESAPELHTTSTITH